MLITLAAVLIGSTQNLLGTFFACSILLQTSTRCRYFLSATLFCCGVLAQVYWQRIWHSRKYRENSFELYSPLLSVHKYQIFFPISPSIVSRNFLNFENVLDFSFIRKTHTYLEKSSINVTMYHIPPIDGCLTSLNT